MNNEGILTAGIDAGSSSVKVAINFNKDNENNILSCYFENIKRRPLKKVVATVFEAICEKTNVSKGDIAYIASTGDEDAVDFRSGHFYSMTTHSQGAIYMNPNTNAILDIGALHARAVKIDKNGKVLAQRMTSQCASGSGQFLENIARYLGVPMEEIGQLSCSADAPKQISSICAVLAETDVINMVSRKISPENILKGIHVSIAGRLVRLLRAISVVGFVMVTGGLSKDVGMIKALNECVEKDGNMEFVTHENATMAGAIGSSIAAARRVKQLKDKIKEKK